MKLFVYGLLKKGFSLHENLQSKKFIGKGQVRGFELYTNGSFPYMVKSFADTDVTGEVWEVDNEIVKNNIDLIESAYQREVINVRIGKEIVKAQAYVKEEVPLNCEIIKSGEFGKWEK